MLNHVYEAYLIQNDNFISAFNAGQLKTPNKSKLGHSLIYLMTQL